MSKMSKVKLDGTRNRARKTDRVDRGEKKKGHTLPHAWSHTARAAEATGQNQARVEGGNQESRIKNQAQVESTDDGLDGLVAIGREALQTE